MLDQSYFGYYVFVNQSCYRYKEIVHRLIFLSLKKEFILNVSLVFRFKVLNPIWKVLTDCIYYIFETPKFKKISYDFLKDLTDILFEDFFLKLLRPKVELSSFYLLFSSKDFVQ